MGNCNNLFPFGIAIDVLWRKHYHNHADNNIVCHCKRNRTVGFIPNKNRLNMAYYIWNFRWSLHYWYSIDYWFQANQNGNIPISYGTTLFLADIYHCKWNNMCIRRTYNAKLWKQIGRILNNENTRLYISGCKIGYQTVNHWESTFIKEREVSTSLKHKTEPFFLWSFKSFNLQRERFLQLPSHKI